MGGVTAKLADSVEKLTVRGEGLDLLIMYVRGEILFVTAISIMFDDYLIPSYASSGNPASSTLFTPNLSNFRFHSGPGSRPSGDPAHLRGWACQYPPERDRRIGTRPRQWSSRIRNWQAGLPGTLRPGGSLRWRRLRQPGGGRRGLSQGRRIRGRRHQSQGGRNARAPPAPAGGAPERGCGSVDAMQQLGDGVVVFAPRPGGHDRGGCRAGETGRVVKAPGLRRGFLFHIQRLY